MYFAQFTKIEIETFLVANGDITNWYCLQIDMYIEIAPLG